MEHEAKQQSLFSVAEQRTFTPEGPRTSPSLDIDKSFLQRWKRDIHRYQSRILNEQSVQQPSLFSALSADPIDNQTAANTDSTETDSSTERSHSAPSHSSDPAFTPSSEAIDPSQIDPFTLELHNFFFFQWPADRHPDSACLYFVMDTCVPLLLYVGETCRANQRWKGVHDCKQYVLNYQSLHFKHHIPTAINTGFWWDTPSETRPRQQLESALIYRWRSPFNKENWKFWGTPFIQT